MVFVGLPVSHPLAQVFPQMEATSYLPLMAQHHVAEGHLERFGISEKLVSGGAE